MSAKEAPAKPGPHSVAIAVGDEVLRGYTQDSNTHWLAQRLFALGFPLRRVHVVGDEETEIVAAIHAELGLRPTYLFVSGGLGPTPDDRTMAALGKALDRPLRLHRGVVDHIQVRLDFLHGIGRIASPEMKEANRRMAEVPDGANIIENAIGMAPGLEFPLGPDEDDPDTERHLFVLPGVPREFKTIFEDEIATKYLHGGTAHATEEVHFKMAVEAEFYDILNQVESQFPGVSVGSYPQPERGHLIIRLSGQKAADVRAAGEAIRFAAPGQLYERTVDAETEEPIG